MALFYSVSHSERKERVHTVVKSLSFHGVNQAYWILEGEKCLLIEGYVCTVKVLLHLFEIFL